MGGASIISISRIIQGFAVLFCVLTFDIFLTYGWKKKLTIISITIFFVTFYEEMLNGFECAITDTCEANVANCLASIAVVVVTLFIRILLSVLLYIWRKGGRVLTVLTGYEMRQVPEKNNFKNYPNPLKPENENVVA